MPEIVPGLFLCAFVSVNFALGDLLPCQCSAFKKYELLTVISLMYRNSPRLEVGGILSQRGLFIASAKQMPESPMGLKHFKSQC